MHIPSLEEICWHLLKSSGNEKKQIGQADNSVKNWWNLSISNPKPDLHNINGHAKFGENLLTFTQDIIQKQNTDWQTEVRTTDGRMERQMETRMSNVKL